MASGITIVSTVDVVSRNQSLVNVCSLWCNHGVNYWCGFWRNHGSNCGCGSGVTIVSSAGCMAQGQQGSRFEGYQLSR